MFNYERAIRSLRTCSVEIFTCQLVYYTGLPGYRNEWTVEIRNSTIRSLTAFVPDNHIAAVREELQQTMLQHLVDEALRRGIIPSVPGHDPIPNPQSIATTVDSHKKERTHVRQAFVGPILAMKGWSLLDWSKYAELAYHTAEGYWEGTTAPYASTRLKLAKALGIKVDALPQ